MADQVFNIAKGRVNEYVNRVASNDPSNSALVVVVLEANEVDDTLRGYDDLATLLAAAGNTEWTATNYARKVLTDSVISAPSPDDANDRQDADIPDQTWTSVTGSASTKALICYDPDSTGGTDSDIIPLCHYDFAVTPDGSNITLQINSAGFYRAS